MSVSNHLTASFRQMLKRSQPLRAGIQHVRTEVLGHRPQLNIRTGHQYGKKQLKGVYYNQYYMDPIEKFARMVIPGFKTDLEERREAKRQYQRRRGKGPPKKGSGARSKKK